MLYSVHRADGCDIFSPHGVMHGVNQDWFSGYWQRKAGCGPSTATNMLRYLGGREQLPWQTQTQEDAVRLMHRAWQDVTPGVFGLNSPHRFQEGMDALLKEAGSPMRCRVLEVPQAADKRPDAQEMAAFIAEGLSNDMPVAFLNLHNGSLQNLERWHWVTLLSLDVKGERLIATAADNGSLLRLDLGQWLASTLLGGGFVACG